MKSSFTTESCPTLTTAHSFLIYLLNFLIGIKRFMPGIQMSQQSSVIREFQFTLVALKPLITFKVCDNATTNL